MRLGQTVANRHFNVAKDRWLCTGASAPFCGRDVSVQWRPTPTGIRTRCWRRSFCLHDLRVKTAPGTVRRVLYSLGLEVGRALDIPRSKSHTESWAGMTEESVTQMWQADQTHLRLVWAIEHRVILEPCGALSHGTAERDSSR